MTSQFTFLQAEFSSIFAYAKQAEMLALSDPRAACFYARLALETAIKWLYVSDKSLREPYEKSLSALLHEPTFRQLVGYPLMNFALCLHKPLLMPYGSYFISAIG